MKGFKYVTINDMNKTIRKNLAKIPHDIDFVVGVPRSGMMCGSIIAEFLNVPLIDVDSFLHGNTPSGGGRLDLFRQKSTGKVLIVDDTVNSGQAMNKTKAKLRPVDEYGKYELIYMCIFLEDDRGRPTIDFWLEDLRDVVRQGIQPIYEWNLFNHYPHIMGRFIFDIDGVLCDETGRPDDSNEEAYENYIRNVRPLFVPKVPINCILTYRIAKYEEVTREWLQKAGIKYNYLLMCGASTWQERNRTIDSAVMKGNFYKEHPEFLLFIESDDYQARRIHKISGKQVLCIDTNTLYG